MTGVIRAGSSFEKFGDPYEFSATVVFVETDAYIMGATGTFSKKIFSAIKAEMIRLGMKRVFWERKKDSVKRVVVNL